MAKLADDFLPKPTILHPWPSDRFATTHPRWEPYAGKLHLRICAGEREVTRVPTATQPEPFSSIGPDHWTLGLRKENLDRILRAIQVQVIVAGIGKTYESLGLIRERVQPLTKRDRHHPIALTVQE